MPHKTTSINRAPVLVLWAAVVAERLGFDEDEALSPGKALAGLNAQAKRRRLGIFKPHEQKPHEAREKELGAEIWIEILGWPVPAQRTEDGIRAVKGTEVIEPDGVRRYLQGKFGDDLGAVRSAMQQLAKGFTPKELAMRAFELYEQFRPGIPEGVRWTPFFGQKPGEFKLHFSQSSNRFFRLALVCGPRVRYLPLAG